MADALKYRLEHRISGPDWLKFFAMSLSVGPPPVAWFGRWLLARLVVVRLVAIR
jgi:hypothetical protein